MVLYKERRRFKGFSESIGRTFSKLGLSPNQWTLLTIIFALLTLYFLIKSDFLIAAIFLIITAFIDLVDGSVARFLGKTSNFGAYLDTIVDRYVEAIIIFGLLFATLPNVFIPIYAWIFLYLFGAMMTTYAKSSAKEKELVSKEIKGGFLERAERMLILFIGLLLAFFDAFYLSAIIVILAVLTNISALQRIYIAIKRV